MNTRCDKCGYEIKTPGTTCDRCGVQNRPSASTVVRPDVLIGQVFSLNSNMTAGPAGSQPDGERKAVTALFADIKSSVELMIGLDAEEAQAIIDPALQLMADAVLSYDGYVVHTLGDGLFALFGAPLAHEDHARRAIYAAIDLQRELNAYGSRLESQGRHRLEARVGINTGEVVLRILNTGGRPEYNPIGHPINLAARLQAVAPSTSIIISDSTRSLVEGYFELRPLVSLVLKGIPEPVTAFEVLGLGELRRNLQVSIRRGLTKFVGRREQLKQLNRAFEKASRGRAQRVSIVSEAGAGKSRILFEFVSTIPAHCRVLESYGISYATFTPLAPIIEMLQNLFGIKSNDGQEVRRRKVQQTLSDLSVNLHDALSYFCELFGIEGDERLLSQMHPLIKRARTFEAISEVLKSVCADNPLVLIFEDLHWMDANSLEFITSFGSQIASEELLLITTSRSANSNTGSPNKNFEEIQLQPLQAREADELLAVLVPSDEYSRGMRDEIILRSAGNPFFMEEIVRSLGEQAASAKKSDSAKAGMSIPRLRVPATVEATIAARIDKLPSAQKELLQTIAVIGSRVHRDLIGDVGIHRASNLDEMLVDLQHSEFIYEQLVNNQVIYLFRHVMTQEVAYSSLLVGPRKRLHESIARAIEARYAGSLIDHVGELAHHYRQSNNTVKAVHYLGQVGDMAIRRSAHIEAIDNLRAALQLISTLPDTEESADQAARLWLSLGVSLQGSLGYAATEVEEAYEKAAALADRAGHVSEVIAAIRGHSVFCIVRAEYHKAFRLGDRLASLEVCQEDRSIEHLLVLGLASAYTGRLLSSRRYFTRALRLETQSEAVETIQYTGHTRAGCLSYLAVSEWYLGYPDTAIRHSESAVSLARSVEVPLSLVQAHGMYGLLRHTRGEFAQAERWIDEAIAGATRGGFPYWLTLGLLIKAAIAAERGGGDQSIEQYDQGLSAYRSSGAKLGLPWLLSLRGHMFATRGEVEQGLSTIEEALGCIKETGEKYHEAEIQRLKGEMLLLRGGPDAACSAGSCFGKALAITRRQKTKALELRSALSLAQLRVTQNRSKEALDLLKPVYDWFKEGFDTPDLLRAGDLLKSLRD
jgi:class 3 adenylate cyclase/tetratricopeptide (TPR) repeat protein